MTAQDLARRAETIAKSGLSEASRAIERGTPADFREAKRILTETQRELREVKRQAAEAERSLKLSGQAARAKAAKSGQVVGMFLDSKGRSALARGRAASRQIIGRQENAAIEPYRSLRAAIDHQLGNLATVKDRCTGELDRLKSQTAPSARPARPEPRSVRNLSPTPQSPPDEGSGQAHMPPPEWLPDPYGRHQLRYWSGTTWTEHVADHGLQATDPT
jgi:hypothetical protein